MSNRQTVDGIYAAFGRGDVPAILEVLAEDVAWEHDTKDHGIAVLTPRRGRREVMAFFEGLAVLEFQRFEITGVLEGGRQIAVAVQVEHTHRRTRKRFADLELHLWTFDARGQVAAFRHMVDSHQLWLQQQP
jgi:ketosteroid isomerase-like protein